jgi:hypothetical protein
MKSIELSGGLGNQMFGLSVLASFLGKDPLLQLNTSRLNNRVNERVGHDVRNYALTPFTICGAPIDSIFPVIQETYRQPFPGEYRLRLYFQSKGIFLGGQFWGTPFSFEESLYSELRRIRILRGNFMNFEYIDRAKESIFRDLNLRTFSNVYLDLMSHMQDSDVVGIHIRGGDFAESHRIYLPTQMYYKQALNLFSGKKLVVFSDDYLFAKSVLTNYLGKFHNVVYLNQEYNLSDAEQFMLISNSKNFILCASSFSGVALRIGLTNGRQIIAPESLRSIYGGAEQAGWKWL